MNIEFNDEDLNLLKIMLNKELGDTREEIRHTDNAAFKKALKERESEVKSLLGRVFGEQP